MIRLLVGSATIVAAHRAGKQSAFASEFSGSRLRGGGFPFSPHIAARHLRRVPGAGRGPGVPMCPAPPKTRRLNCGAAGCSVAGELREDDGKIPGWLRPGEQTQQYLDSDVRLKKKRNMKLPCMHLLLAVGAQATPCSPRAVERRDRACARARAWLRDKQLACPEFFALPAGADPCAACPEPPISTGTPCGLGPPGGAATSL